MSEARLTLETLRQASIRDLGSQSSPQIFWPEFTSDNTDLSVPIVSSTRGLSLLLALLQSCNSQLHLLHLHFICFLPGHSSCSAIIASWLLSDPQTANFFFPQFVLCLTARLSFLSPLISLCTSPPPSLRLLANFYSLLDKVQASEPNSPVSPPPPTSFEHLCMPGSRGLPGYSWLRCVFLSMLIGSLSIITFIICMSKSPPFLSFK